MSTVETKKAPTTLQERIDAKHSAKTVWDSPKDRWEYITIPEENPLGEKHASIANNNHVFEAGKTYLVPPEIAEDVKDRLRVYQRACVRVLQPTRDYKAERQVAIGSTNPGGNAVDPSTIG
jgi:hypothetical protein